MDYYEIGPVPTEENCAQAGTEGFGTQALKECRAYINQLRRVVGEEPDGAELRIKSNPHGFRTCYEVACYYEIGNPEAEAYAFRCDEEAPSHWDSEARAELGI